MDMLWSSFQPCYWATLLLNNASTPAQVGSGPIQIPATCLQCNNQEIIHKKSLKIYIELALFDNGSSELQHSASPSQSLNLPGMPSPFFRSIDINSSQHRRGYVQRRKVSNSRSPCSLAYAGCKSWIFLGVVPSKPLGTWPQPCPRAAFGHFYRLPYNSNTIQRHLRRYSPQTAKEIVVAWSTTARKHLSCE